MDSIENRLAGLEGLLTHDTTAFQRKQIQQEIRNLKKGAVGERKVAFHLNNLYPNHAIAHDVRLNVNGKIAQIDHIGINRFGVVKLYETKSFNRDVMIDEDGVFHYFDRKNQSYKPFPSPIEQSKRHETVLLEAFAEIGFLPLSVMHFVVFDYQSKITKPSEGFENVCYLDMIEKANENEAVKTGVLDVFSMLKTGTQKLLKQNPLSPEEALKVIVERFHQPFEIDYRAKFGLDKTPDMPVKVESQIPTDPLKTNDDYDLLTLAKAAKALGMKTPEFEAILLEQGFLARHPKGYLVVTDTGKAEGIQWRRGKGGYYYLIPKAQLPLQE